MSDEPNYFKLNVGRGWFYHLINQIEENSLRRYAALNNDDTLSDEMKRHLTALMERNACIKEWILRNTDADGMVLLSDREYQALFWILLENTDTDDDDDDYDSEEDKENDE